VLRQFWLIYSSNRSTHIGFFEDLETKKVFSPGSVCESTLLYASILYEALKARNSKAQGASPGVRMKRKRALQGRHRGFCFALTALYLLLSPNPGLAPCALLFRAFGAVPA
jgi:hypothetical protein